MSKRKGRLRQAKLDGRKDTLYKFLGKKNDGIVPCFVCGKHVKYQNATMEHILPLSKGGTDEMDNLSVSHYQCNVSRGNDETFSWDKKSDKVSDDHQSVRKCLDYHAIPRRTSDSKDISYDREIDMSAMVIEMNNQVPKDE